MTEITYELLLELYRGKASVVEQLSERQRRALAVDVPLFSSLRDIARNGTPRHVFLTGNAGDGKTFAALTAEVEGMTVIYDASASEHGGASPIDVLAHDLTTHLDAGHRLLVAINRGQLERLETQTTGGPLVALIAAARDQGRLRETWPAQADPTLTLIDLGLVDTANEAIVDPVLDRVAAASASSDLSPETAAAFAAALISLREAGPRQWIRTVLTEARSHGQHITMRQLWSFVAFLVTGARAPEDRAPTTLRDSLGARLFRDDADGPLFDVARGLDPALRPDVETARRVLFGIAIPWLAATPGVGPLATIGDAADGRTILRVAAVHKKESPPTAQDVYARLVKKLMDLGPGWHAFGPITSQLLRGAYERLRLPASGGHFPAWQYLCYDSARLATAAAVAAEELDPSALRLALPRPSPAAERALGGAWRPPFLWLALAGEGEEPARASLRLTPRLFAALYAAAPDVQLTEAELLTLQRWVGRTTRARRMTEAILVGHFRSRRRLAIQEDPLLGTTSVTWEGTDGH